MSKNKDPNKITVQKAAEMFDIGWHRTNTILSKAKSRQRIGQMFVCDKQEAIRLIKAAQAGLTGAPAGTIIRKKMPARYHKTAAFFTELFKSAKAPKPTGYYIAPRSNQRTAYYDIKKMDKFMAKYKPGKLRQKPTKPQSELNNAFRIAKHAKT